MASRQTRAAVTGGLTVGLVLLVAVAGRPPSTREEARGAPTPPPPVTPATGARADAESRATAPPSPAIAVPAPSPDPEVSLTDRLRALVDGDPAAALRLAEEGERRFPGGARGDERSFLKMRALVHLGRIGDARSEAEAFFERFPGSPYGVSAYRLTGVHPRPPPPFARGGADLAPGR